MGHVMRILVAGLVLLAARHARADCVYHNDYYDPGLSGGCTAEVMVPEGCPLHVVTPGEPPQADVYRGADPVAATVTATPVETIFVPMNRIDPFDCDCASVPGSASFVRHEVTLGGVRDGDRVELHPGKLEYSMPVLIGPPGPCPEPVWPTTLVVLTRCDQCGGGGGDDDGGGGGGGGGGGCAAGGGAGLALGLGLVGVLVLRRRRPR